MGGPDHCSEARKQLVRRFSAAAVLAEAMESKLANGEQIDVAEHCLLTSTMTRVASRIGIDRIPREVGDDDDALELYERAMSPQRQCDRERGLGHDPAQSQQRSQPSRLLAHGRQSKSQQTAVP